MPFSGMLRRVVLVRTDVSEEHTASDIRVKRIGELGTTLVVTRATLLLIQEDGIHDRGHSRQRGLIKENVLDRCTAYDRQDKRIQTLSRNSYRDENICERSEYIRG
jgi:hypothetical protein